MGKQKYLEDLKVLSEEQIYNKYIIGGEIWYFRQAFNDKWFDKYNEFRIFISQKLEVHYNDIAIAGSAKLGFSINPKKNFKAFGENSDIDIIIVSRKYYYQFWEAYRNDSYAEIRIRYFKWICFAIFRRYIVLEGFDENNEIYKKWLKKTQGFEKDLQLVFDISNDIHYRIFESWDAAKDYYLSTIRKNIDVIKGGVYGENK